ncbi:N(6)-adenine-specific methyltransferase METTL4 [Drosophila guanche]|uniref:Blast:Methyltransferase-like protein 4 n=1 Tax=Drosophila guanche TaxID=7266 RepID=A0A3B0KDS1_DROGU|nr:N(6)-adenine-specific methyltransferase METTL4 [Drosophila guanche]SPP83171.1 blast:Methyltransferase-like protein 4 [Drosophila guanche]
MLKLQAKAESDRFAVFLDHRRLINEAYSNGDYQLKSSLFQFEAKRAQPLDEQKKSKKRKRVPEDLPDEADSHTIEKYLAVLPTPVGRKTATPLPRYWEAPYTLPQLHGANQSGQVQKFHSGDEANTSYIIPDRARFYNHNVDHLPALLPQLLPSYDLIVVDPPWRNKYIRRLKRVKQELGYSMLDNDQLALLPLAKLTNTRTLVAIWCTNSIQHQTALETHILPSWNLRLLHKVRWYKLSTDHQLVGPLHADPTQKQPYEMLYVACHTDSHENYGKDVQKAELILSVPSIVHSHKPPLLPWLRQHIELDLNQADPNCLELFARYLQPQFTSIGLEVLKLMDERLYEARTHNI